MSDNTARIRELNDEFRKLRTPPGRNSGKVVITSGVQNTLGKTVLEALDLVANFDAFTVDNDPHGEHDFGSIEIENHQLFWKIDYYDASMAAGSEDPSDPTQTTRVLTLMLTEEY